MNPLKLLQLKSAWDRFKSNHPKFPKFLSTIYGGGMKEGTVIEFHVTSPEGKTISCNVKLKQDDVALFKELTELFS